MDGEPFDPFLEVMGDYPQVSVAFAGVANDDNSRGWFFAVFEKGEEKSYDHQSYYFQRYQNDDDCIAARDNAYKDIVEAKLRGFLAG